MTPTNKLRWVERNEPYQGRTDVFSRVKVLQQWFPRLIPGQVATFHPTEGEWVDIPVVLNDGDD